MRKFLDVPHDKNSYFAQKMNSAKVVFFYLFFVCFINASYQVFSLIHFKFDIKIKTHQQNILALKLKTTIWTVESALFLGTCSWFLGSPCSRERCFTCRSAHWAWKCVKSFICGTTYKITASSASRHRGSLLYWDFWTWKKNTLLKICFSGTVRAGTVGGPLLIRKSPTWVYISQKLW